MYGWQFKKMVLSLRPLGSAVAQELTPNISPFNLYLFQLPSFFSSSLDPFVVVHVKNSEIVVGRSPP